jgi:hypothetical protein
MSYISLFQGQLMWNMPLLTGLASIAVQYL